MRHYRKTDIGKIVDGIRAVFPSARIEVDDEIMREGYGPPASALLISISAKPTTYHHREVFYHYEENIVERLPKIVASIAGQMTYDAVRFSA